jgi:uracil-DNA glycosylase
MQESIDIHSGAGLSSTQTMDHSGTRWKEALKGEKESPYFLKLMEFIESERRKGKSIYPPKRDVFRALSLTHFEDVRVVIVGQDPYPGPNQAHGLCFSVQKGVPLPGSLQNIFKELGQSLGVSMPSHGCLESWACQGVLLLNTVLTVEAGKPHSHANLGWEKFTDRVINELNRSRTGLVFLLWGSHAQKKCANIDSSKHSILTAAHPSPLSAHRGFLGCNHFKRTNEILVSKGQKAISWALK